MPGDTSRDDFAAAIAELEARDKPAEQSDTSIEGGDPIEQSDPTKPEPAPKPSQSRDEQGRYAPKTPAKDPPVQNTQPTTKEEQTPQVGTEQATAQVERAPASWRPEEREGWAGMAAHHRSAILRREREVDEVLRQSSNARRWHEEFSRVVQPYEHIFRAENTNPVAAADALFRTAAALRTSTPQHKAQLVADLIADYQIDIEALDGAIVARSKGGPRASVGSQHDPILQAIDARLKPINDFIQNNQNSRQKTIEQEWQEFSQANEFAEDLRQDMGDLMHLASQRGATLTLQDAYKRAMLAHPTISALVERRKQTSAPAQQQDTSAAARRAAAASASLPQSGAAPSQDGEEEQDDTRLGDIRATIRQLSGTRGR